MSDSDQPRVSEPPGRKLPQGFASRFGAFVLIAVAAASFHCPGSPRRVEEVGEQAVAVPAPVRQVEPPVARDAKPKTVVLIVIDGARWQEIYGGTDRALAKTPRFAAELDLERARAGAGAPGFDRERRRRARRARARGRNRSQRRDERCREHGRKYPESARAWLVSSGTGIVDHGFVSAPRPRKLADIAPTVRALLGLEVDTGASAGTPLTELLSAPVETRTAVLE